jgi:D-glycero-alpha-D-manno-heptose-7-phosphate kinase
MTQPLRSIHSRAPVRICDIGGWTDTWFARHGKIFNIAVSPFVEVSIDVFPRTARAEQVIINALNYSARFAHSDDWMHHPMLEAAVSYLRPPQHLALEISLHSDMPAGASTGTSAAVSVALLAALDALRTELMTPHQLAYAAHAVETELLKRQCGIQDQLAAAHGGICDIDMYAYPNATVTQVLVPETTRLELERRLLLFFLGKSHDSSAVHEKVIRELESSGPDDPRIEALRGTGPRARDALLAGDFDALGAAMIDNSRAQAGLNPVLIGSDSQRIIDIAISHGVIGWKVNGAGGDGGSITLLCGPQAVAKHALCAAIEASGPYRRIPIALSPQGVRVW